MLAERFLLCQERLEELSDNTLLSGELDTFFKKQALFVSYMAKIFTEISDESLDNISTERLKGWNTKLYEDIIPVNYGVSYCNPDYAVDKFGEKLGRLLTAVAAEMRSCIGYVYEGRCQELLIRGELLLELYMACCDALDGDASDYDERIVDTLTDIVYWYVSDYSDEESLQRIREMVDPSCDFATRLVLDSDLGSTDYLYKYGEYVTANEERLSAFMASLSEEKIKKIADTYTEGYRIGFVMTGKDLSKKTTVNIRYPIGMERVVKQSIQNFKDMGLDCIIYRAGNSFFRRQGTNKIGYYGANPNKQYDFDHKEDEALFLDGNFVTRKLECLENAFEEYKEMAYGHAGPAVIESFGENDPELISKESVNALSKEKQELSVKLTSRSGAITNRYIKGEERSFTIIAFPVPDIGDDFEAIFEETIKINTLDYKLYQRIQGSIIDELDKGCQVHVVGSGVNETDLTVSLIDLPDPEHQTKFENCVADVNIPVGEVFTSPKLAGTTGLLHVSQVYLEGLEYKNLKVWLKDGMVEKYDCSNFEDAAANEKYIRDNVMFHHDTLTVGEFAIGTNTAAYVMARKFGIAAKMPILIAEKTGPHFALGDTCYSHAEDIVVYNPDGKEIYARDNEHTLIRKENPEKAYYNCHTDITIPYDELKLIEIIHPDGNRVSVIEDGRFVLPGTEELNKALDEYTAN